MAIESKDRINIFFENISSAISVIIFLSGTAVFFGWIFDIGVLKSVFPNWVTMKASTAVCFILVGLSLSLEHNKRSKNNIGHSISKIFAFLIFSIGFLVFLEYIYGLDFKIDQLLFKESQISINASSSGRMAFNSSILFCILGLIILSNNLRNSIFTYIRQVCALGVILISILSTLRYFYGIEFFYVKPNLSFVMAIHTAILFILSGLGILFLRPKDGLMKLVSSDSLGGFIIRRLGPIVIVIPLFFGWLKITSQESGLISDKFGVALVAILNMSVIFAFIYAFSLLVNKLELKRLATDQKLIESSEKYRTLFQNMAEGVFYQDRSGVLVDINASALEMFGLTREEFLRRTSISPEWKVVDLNGNPIPSDDHPSVIALREGEPVRDRMIGIYNPRSNAYRWINVNAIPLFKEKEKTPYQVFVTMHDITQRKIAEGIAKKSREEIGHFFNSALDLLCIADTDGHFLKLNPEWEMALGYTLKELEGRLFLDLVHPDDVDSTVKAMAMLSDQKTILNFVNRYRRKDGSYRWIEWRSVPVGNTIYASARDITERKKIEDELKSEVNMRNILLENLPCIAMILKKDTREIVFSNEAARKIGAIPGKKCFETCADRRDPCPFCLAPELWKTNEPQKIDVEYNGRYYEGRWMPFSADLYVHYIFDRTEHKKAEDLIRNSEKKFKELFNNMSSGVAVYKVMNDGQDFIIQDFNRAAEKIENIKRESIINRSVLEVFPGIKEMQLFNCFRRVYKTGVPEECPTELYKDNRVSGWRENFVYKLPTGEIVSIYNDVTERKKIEEARRLSQLGHLVAAMAHEINNPLMIISGAAQMSLMEKIDNKKVESYLKDIVDETKRTKYIIERLLSYSKPGKKEIKKFDINDCIDHITDLLSRHFKADNIDIVKEYDRSIPLINGDEKQLEEVFMNLITNAKDAISKNGVITISTAREGDYIVLKFRDNGEGISSANLARIFEPFFSTKETGTGLGLPVSYGIIRNHGGEMRYESEVGVGTTVNIKLPIK